ncbi:MAG: dihydropteroate synthase [Spirochaetaceae bacterium]|nr:dihydropteroate synthase [Spirochaetaceae bacterium]
MGVINTTPDSFFPFSRKNSIKKGVSAALKMVSEGADIIDIGGESTRPGSHYIDEQEELKRVIPILKEIAINLKIPISIDTRKSKVAYEALNAGAVIINDISSMEDDHAMTDVIKESGCDIIIMHKAGIPSDMQKNNFYNNVKVSADLQVVGEKNGGEPPEGYPFFSPAYTKVFMEQLIAEVYQKLENLTKNAVSKGIDESKITIDPGLGFGKKADDDIAIIDNIAYFKKLGFPVLIGHSRKSFIGTITGKNVEERLAGSLAAGIVSLINGADILRVHDVKETIDTVKVVRAFMFVGR